MTKHDECIVIVNPYLDKSILQFLAKTELKIIAYYTSGDPGEFLAPRRSDDSKFAFVFYEEKEGYSGIIDKLKKMNVTRVINGVDKGIKIALKIGHDLQLKNAIPVASGEFFCNKYLTGEFLKKRGLFPSAQFTVNAENKESAIEQAIKEIGFPLIIKPAASAGSFGFYICNSASELTKSADELLGAQDKFGNRVDKLVIQEKLVGQELAVCSISTQKKHLILAILAYDQGLLYGQNMVRSLELADPAKKEYEKAIQYVKSILDAVDYRSGPAATEIMLTQSGPCLIEVNPRVAGINVEELLRHCIGKTQGEMIALSITDEKLFLKLAEAPIKRIGYGRIVFLRNNREGNTLTQVSLDEIKKLKSCKQMNITYKVGDKLTVTTDLFSIVANILICNENEDQFKRDYARLMEIEDELFS